VLYVQSKQIMLNVMIIDSIQGRMPWKSSG